MAPGSDPKVLRVNALRVQQHAIPLYVFGIDGRLVRRFASVQFAARNGAGELVGYQRSRVERHIREIREYLEQDGALLPNAIVVAFDGSTMFTPIRGEIQAEWGTLGRLTIPIPPPRSAKPAVIVDGQQRMSAFAELSPARSFPIVVVGFSSASEETQREQFVLVNRTKPLPRDLLNELVADVDGVLPRAWRLRRVTASVVHSLRYDENSPFYGRIRGIGAIDVGANISQAAVIDAIERSVKRRGALCPDSQVVGQADVASMARIVSVYFAGVKRVWPTAWEGSPWSSRLVHGVGIYALGRLMDLIMLEVDATKPRAVKSVAVRLDRLKSRCAWTHGRWPVLRCEWNELQNTSQDKRLLADYLLKEFRRLSK